MSPRVSCRLSTTGIRLLGILLPRSSAPLTVGLPSSQRLDPTGFPRSAHQSRPGLGALFTPRPSGAHTTGPIPPAAARPSTRGQALSPRSPIPSPRAVHYEASSRVHSRSPARPSPSPGDPLDGSGALGLFPGLRTPTGRTCGAPGRGTDIEHSPGATTDTVGPPIHELTRNVRPRVARLSWT